MAAQEYLAKITAVGNGKTIAEARGVVTYAADFLK
jgi:acyl-CoA reductase-like NAD-dependent aldehyde dehydrogenase